jgi:hypothetical protein
MAIGQRALNLRASLDLEVLETRAVPAGGMATVREVASASITAITAVRDQFRNDLGIGVQEVNWDTVPDNLADPNALPGSYFANLGLNLTTPGTSFRVSGSPNVVGDSQSRFGMINSTYRTSFQTLFSSPRLFTPIGSNLTIVTFTVPGTNQAAAVRGFGAVFSDVDTANGAKLEFFDRDGNLILSRNVPPLAGNGNLSFLGASFADAVVARVEITTGTAALSGSVDDITQAGPADLVVLDNFVFGQPVRLIPRVPLSQNFAVGTDRGASPVVKTYTPNGTEQRSITAFNPFFTGGVRVAVGDFNGDGVADFALGSGPGIINQVRVVDGKTGVELAFIQPFESTYTGGVYVAAGDLTGEGVADLVITPDEGGGPRVQIYSGGTFLKFADFFGIDDANFRGGARPAIGDINGDGLADLVVAAGFGGGPRVAIYDGLSLFNTVRSRLMPDFFAFEPSLRDGVYVAVGDVNGDGFGDLILGGGPQGGPRVLVLSGRVLLVSQTYNPILAIPVEAPLASFFVGDPNSRGGIRVAAKDLDGDSLADIVTGSGTGVGTLVTAYYGAAIVSQRNPLAGFTLDAFPGLEVGIFVG